MKKLAAACAATLGLLSFTSAPASAQSWPQKPIRMIVPYPAGGGTDFVGRLVAEHLSHRLNQPIYVENRGGANGAVGLQALKQSEPDGYTIAATSDTPMTVNPWLYKDMSYDPLHDFVPIASVVRLPGMLAANPVAAGKYHRRVDRAGEAKTRRHRLWLRRCRQFQPSGDGIVLAGDGREAPARAL